MREASDALSSAAESQTPASSATVPNSTTQEGQLVPAVNPMRNASEVLPPTSPTTNSRTPEGQLVPVTTLSAITTSSDSSSSVKSDNASESPKSCIILSPFIKMKQRQLFFHGDPAYFFHVSPKSCRETLLGLSLKAIEEKIVALETQYATVLAASGVNADDLSKSLEELSIYTSQKRQKILTMYSYPPDYPNNHVADACVNKVYNTPKTTEAFENLCNHLKSFGNLPLTLSFLRLATNRTNELLIYGKQFENIQDYFITCDYRSILFYLLSCASGSSSPDTLQVEVLKSFIELHEYLYKQQVMKQLVELYNRVAAKTSGKYSVSDRNAIFKGYIWELFTENSKVMPPFKMFITYQGFRKKMTYLINAMKLNIPTKRNLLKCFEDVESDQELPTLAKKYEKVVERLYNALETAYNVIAKLNDAAFPKKWVNFNEVFVIINYLSSSENPYARKNLSVPEKYDANHIDALTQFDRYQNNLNTDAHVVHLDDEVLKTFYITEENLLFVKLSAIRGRDGVLSAGDLMRVLCEEQNDSLLLPLLANQPTNQLNPLAPTVASAKQMGQAGFFPTVNSGTGAATSTALVPAGNLGAGRGTNTALVPAAAASSSSANSSRGQNNAPPTTGGKSSDCKLM